MQGVGAEEATDKAVPPTTRLEFLGNTVDTVKMTLEVSESRKTKLMALLDRWMSMENFLLKQLQSLIGKLSFVTNCVRVGRIFINRLLNMLRNIDNAQNLHQ